VHTPDCRRIARPPAGPHELSAAQVDLAHTAVDRTASAAEPMLGRSCPAISHIDLHIWRPARRLERIAATTMLCGGHGVTHSPRLKLGVLPATHIAAAGQG
jgi:hypothetical protein